MIILRKKEFSNIKDLTKLGGLSEKMAARVRKGSSDPIQQQYLKDIASSAKKNIKDACSVRRLPNETKPQFMKRLGVHNIVGGGHEKLKERAEMLRFNRSRR